METENSSTRRLIRPSNELGLAEQQDTVVNIEQAIEIDKRVGLEIRQLRKASLITIGDLSKLTGLSKGYLSQIERGISTPSIKALHSISRALGVTISWFFSHEDPEERDLCDVVVRASNRRSLRFSSGITDELLSPNLDRQLELLRCTFSPGAQSGTESYTHDGEEAGFVVSGSLNLWIDEKEVVLQEGDSFAFSSKIPHRYANHTNTKTVVIWAITPPSY